MGSLLGDIRVAWRRLTRAGGVAVAIASIALGVGASSALFGAVDQVLLSPLPYPNAERVIEIEDRGRDGAPLAVAYGNFVEIAARNRSFESLAVADAWRPALVGAGDAERLDGERVSPDFFRVLGVSPARGRNFEAADDVAGAPLVAIVSAGLAARRFGGADAVLGRTLALEGVPHTVVGVMPAEFENALRPDAEVWAPLRFRAQAPFQSAEWGHRLRMIGRLRDDVSLEQARTELNALASEPVEEFSRAPSALLEHGLSLESLQAAVTREVRPVLLAIFGAVLLLLALASANVANILLARALARRGELALRAALGAEQRRIVQQLFAESALVAAVGGALGVCVAALGTRALVALAPAELPRAATLGFDTRVLAFALVATVVVAFVVGLLPALRARELGAYGGFGAGARVTPAGVLMLRRALVVAQVALATVLLASAGLLLRSVVQLLEVPLGFEPARVATLRIAASSRSNEELQALFQRMLDAVQAVPGVAAAAVTSQLPLSGDRDAYGVRFESLEGPDPEGAGGAFRYVVTPSWFETMGIELKRGRLLGAEDSATAAPAVLISESFAARRFGARDPLGARVRIGPDIARADLPARTVVGVVADVKQSSLAAAVADAFYVPLGQWPWVDSEQSLVVRTAAPAPVLDAVKRAIGSVDPALPVERLATMQSLVAASEAQRTFALTIFAAFGLAALLLAGVGVYGVIEGRVTERTRELGLRSALGAAPAKLASMVVGQGLALTALGLVVGGVAAQGAARGIAALLYGVEPFDPFTYVGVAALLLAVTALSCYAPAARAARIDPAIALRAEG